MTGHAVADLINNEAMGAVVGAAGLGKTFAIAHALESRTEPVVHLAFEARPTMRLVADRLLNALTGAPWSGTRFAMTAELLERLSERRRLVVIGEAQNLNRDCFEYLRHLHDDPTQGSRCYSTAATVAGRCSRASRCSTRASTGASPLPP
jgi:DNA transposition AAA+ family ATPase